MNLKSSLANNQIEHAKTGFPPMSVYSMLFHMLIIFTTFFAQILIGGDDMDYEVKKVKMEDEFKVCPSCGYKDGFHSMFKQEANVTKWLFICPACHDVFDINLTI